MAKQERSRRTGTRTPNKPASVAEIEQALRNAEDHIPPGYEAKMNFDKEVRELRRSLASQLQRFVARDVDLAKAEGVIASYERKKARLMTRRMAGIGRELSASTGTGRALARGGLEALRGADPFGSATVLTLAPFLIWARRPSSMLTDSRIEPVGYSWAKAKLLKDNVYDTSTVVFYYLWSNPSNAPAVVNARCHAIFNGMLSATANHGILSGGDSWASCDVWLVPLQWWTQPALADFSQTPQQWQSVAIAHAQGGGIWAMGGDLDVTPVSDVHRDVRFDQFLIPGGASAVFEVQARFNYTIEDGSVGFNFASQPSYSIASLFQLEIPIQRK